MDEREIRGEEHVLRQIGSILPLLDAEPRERAPDGHGMGFDPGSDLDCCGCLQLAQMEVVCFEFQGRPRHAFPALRTATDEMVVGHKLQRREPMLALDPVEVDVDRNAGDLCAGHGVRELVVCRAIQPLRAEQS